MNHKEIPNWCDSGIEKIYDLIVKEAPYKSNIVEIGVWKGSSFCYLCQKIKESSKNILPIAIDKFTGDEYGINGENGTIFPEFKKNLEDRNFFQFTNWESVVLDSIEASSVFNDNELFAVFLDGNHCTEYVSKEIDVWLPKIQKGGILAFHDYLDPNLRRLFNQKLNPIEDYESCGLYRKL